MPGDRGGGDGRRRWVGRGDKNGADKAAVDAMRRLIGTVQMSGVVVIGEGEKDEAPMLFNGEEVGDGTGPACDVAVDPIDGTTLAAKGMSNAIAVMADRRARHDVRPVGRVLHGQAGHRPGGGQQRRHRRAGRVQRRRGRQVEGRLAARTSPSSCSTGRGTRTWPARSATTGARIKFISDGDVAGAIMACREGTGVDLLLGIGGTPEGIITACAVKCTGGVIQAKLWPRDDAERGRAIAAGHDLDRVLLTDDLVRGDNVFFAATGITDGELLRGVRYRGGGASTQSLVMRSRSGTIRTVTSEHQLVKLRAYSSIDYGQHG